MSIVTRAVLVAGLLLLAVSTGNAKDKETTQQGDEYKYQQPGQPLYMDPSTMTSQGINDLHTGSDPMVNKEHEAAGGGAHQGPTGEVKDDVKVIEGPVHYEPVKE